MNLVVTLLSTLLLAAKRVWHQRLLMLCLLAGLAAAIGVLSSIPLYADAVQHRLLLHQLAGATPSDETPTNRPPFAFLWRYVGAWHGDVGWAAYEFLDRYVSQQAVGVIGLPLTTQVRHVKTGNLRLFAVDGEGSTTREPLLWTSLGFIDGLEGHVDLVEGALPAAGAPGDDIEVLASQALAEQLGLQIGERYILFGSGEAQLPVRVVGVWRPGDVTDPFWFYAPESFDPVLLTAEPAFGAQVAPALDAPVSLAAWYQIFDGGSVRSAGVARLLERVAAVQARAATLLKGTALDVSPVEALEGYRRSARLLTVQLTLFGIPVVGLALYFMSLIAGMIVRRDRAEIAVLRSRGTSREQVTSLYLLEGLLIGGAGLPAGLALGRRLADAMGRMQTFLDPALWTRSELRPSGDAGPLAVIVSPAALGYALLGLALAMVALLIPALSASRHTIVTYRRERARALPGRGPLWQRTFLDVLLLALPLYGWYLLHRQGSIVLLGRGDDPFANPLLFLVPVLFCLALSLVAARLFPWLMAALAWLADWLPGVAPLLALRQLARSARDYTGPLLLLSLTLSLAVFSASVAATLTGHLRDQAYYRVGADVRLAELGESTEPAERATAAGSALSESAGQDAGPRWLFLPVSEHLRVAGVRAAARVGSFAILSDLGGQQETGRLLGVDRLDFPAVAFYRPDFGGGESLGGLMNRLAVDPAHVLVSRDFVTRHGLGVGDPLRLTVGVGGDYHDVEFVVAGVLDLFPSLYPQDSPFFVANLEHVFEGLGGAVPYDVWLAVDPAVAADQVVSGVRELGVPVVAAIDARAAMAREQTQPERQGVLGLLSIGFVAAAALTALGLLVYAATSFRRRFIELGTLRAVGLSAAQMAAYLAAEQALLVLVGAALGTGLGVAAGRLFIPYLQVGVDKAALVPPFVVRIAWNELWTIYAVFGGVLAAAVTVLVGLLARMKVFEAIKLGETG